LAARALGGAPSGATDGARAFLQAQTLGQPAGSAIYATADFDDASVDDEIVIAYFAAFKRMLNGEYKLGVYANGATCQMALDAGVSDFTWLAGGMGMRGSRAFLDTGKATLIQDVGDKQGLNLGINVDSDIATVSEYGGWQLPQGFANV
jgi:hypothetical protein